MPIYVNLTQTGVTWEEGISIEKMPISDWPVVHFLINKFNEQSKAKVWKSPKDIDKR